jgi:cysteine desulfurase
VTVVPAEIYLDNNATTRPLPAVVEAVLEALGPSFGNPSSAHSAGDRSRALLERARESVAHLIGAPPDRVIFTSGGTEANNTVLGSALGLPVERRRVVTSTVEHSSVLSMCENLERTGIEVVRLGVDAAGFVSLGDVERALERPTGLVSIQWVNNETGVIQPVEAIGRLCAAAGALFHTDAAQAAGKLDIDVGAFPLGYLTLTAHKFHGPQGVGALYCRDRRSLVRTLWGGGQEAGLRAGTENLAGIAGFAKAAELRKARLNDVRQYLAQLRDSFERAALEALPDVRVNGDVKRRVCNSTSLLFSGVDGQALVARLDSAGVRCSQSSACTNMRPEPSYVLRAMGLSARDAYASIRFSFAETNTADEVRRAVTETVSAVKSLRDTRVRLTASH